MAFFVLIYDVVDDYGQRRTPFRPAHFQKLHEARDRGELFIAGALGDPPNGALLVFKSDSPAAAQAFAASDPYVLNGLVTKWQVRPWNVVISPEA